MGQCGRDADIDKKRLSTLVLDGSKFGSFFIQVKNEATIGSFWYDNYAIFARECEYCIYCYTA